MGKQIFKMIFLLIVVFGICSGVYITVSRDVQEKQEIEQVEELFASLQNREAEIAKFYTYGDSLGLSGSLNNISKERTYDLTTNLEGKLLMFETTQINKGAELDKLEVRKLLCTS